MYLTTNIQIISHKLANSLLLLFLTHPIHLILPNYKQVLFHLLCYLICIWMHLSLLFKRTQYQKCFENYYGKYQIPFYRTGRDVYTDSGKPNVWKCHQRKRIRRWQRITWEDIVIYLYSIPIQCLPDALNCFLPNIISNRVTEIKFSTIRSVSKTLVECNLHNRSYRYNSVISVISIHNFTRINI